ncbi:MAG: hypothetical protein WEA77_07035 [Hyphomonas sp.]
MFPANPRANRATPPGSFPEDDMRTAIALFVIIGLFLEPAWSQALIGA